MYKQKTILAVIPARAGSKGFPGKNVRPLSGKPLIAWSIEQSLSSRYIDKVMVSTESPAIAEVARRYGAEVPFLRPEKLAGDMAKSADVLLDVIRRLEKNGKPFNMIMLLQPTSPLRNCADIDASIRWLFARNAKSVVSVCALEHSPLWANILPADYSMKDFIRKDLRNKNRQELPSFYRLNGAIYLAEWEYFKEQKGFLGDKAVAFVMPVERSADIDTPQDFEFAEYLKSKHQR